MKNNQLFLLLFLLFPFFGQGMKTSKIPSPLLDRFVPIEQRPGNPKLFKKVQYELERYCIAKETIEDLKCKMNELNLDVMHLDTIAKRLPRLSNDIINDIMVDLYVVVQGCSNNPKLLSNNVSIVMKPYLNY